MDPTPDDGLHEELVTLAILWAQDYARGESRWCRNSAAVLRDAATPEGRAAFVRGLAFNARPIEENCALFEAALAIVSEHHQ